MSWRSIRASSRETSSQYREERCVTGLMHCHAA